MDKFLLYSTLLVITAANIGFTYFQSQKMQEYMHNLMMVSTFETKEEIIDQVARNMRKDHIGIFDAVKKCNGEDNLGMVLQ